MIPGIGQMTIKNAGLGLKLNLASHFSFEETSGNTALDAQNSNNGTIYNCTLSQTGKVGKCYSYNGSNSKILIPSGSIYNNNGNISINAWFSASSTSGLGTIFAMDFGGTLRIQSNSGTLRVSYSSSYDTWPPVLLDVYSLVKNTWYMVTVVFENIYEAGYKQRCTAYVNDSFASTSTKDQADGGWNMNPVNGISIGCVGYSSYFFNGLIDEVSFWTRTLSQSEIVKLFNYGNGLSFQNM